VRIAAFDSGIGGLSAVLPLLARHPQMQIDYLGDLANLPYGTKSAEEIRALTEANLAWLLRQEPELGAWDRVVVACGTVTSRAFEVAATLARAQGAEAVGVIAPLCESARASGRARVIVLGTPASVAAGQFMAGLRDAGYPGAVTQVPCPALVGLAERGLFEGAEAEAAFREYLDPLQPDAGDAVILGCTHYSYFREFLAVRYPGAAWIDAGSSLEALFAPASTTSLVPPAPRLRLRFTGHLPPPELLQRVFAMYGLNPARDAHVERIAPL
jgi:glutamate racemase